MMSPRICRLDGRLFYFRLLMHATLNRKEHASMIDTNALQVSATSYRMPRQRLSLVRDGSLQSTWKYFANSLEAF